jgi:hypothetical protein
MANTMLAFASRRTPNFWVWFVALVAGALICCVLTLQLLMGHSTTSDEAMNAGLRIVIRAEDGTIRGKQARCYRCRYAPQN